LVVQQTAVNSTELKLDDCKLSMILNNSENVIDGSNTNTSEVNFCEFSNAIENDVPYCLSNQPDFKSQRPWLKEVVEDDIGATIIYYPKFHCELNYIEMVWAYIKAYLRRNCTYTFKDLKQKSLLNRWCPLNSFDGHHDTVSDLFRAIDLVYVAL
jgi:hypothetical protein